MLISGVHIEEKKLNLLLSRVNFRLCLKFRSLVSNVVDGVLLVSKVENRLRKYKCWCIEIFGFSRFVKGIEL